MEAVQLTERDKNAIWKTKEHGMILMADMTEHHLQCALVICQKRQLKSLEMIQLDLKLEEQLLKEAKNRNFPIQHLDEAKDTALSTKYNEVKELIRVVSNSIKRKLKTQKSIKIEGHE